MNAKTSLCHPLRIDAVTAPGGGQIGMTLCPGKVKPRSVSGPWARDLIADIDAIRAWGAGAVVTLMESHELEAVGVAGLGERVEEAGIEWHHLPIRDVDVPDRAFEDLWLYAGHRLRRRLSAGGSPRAAAFCCIAWAGWGAPARSPCGSWPSSACRRTTRWPRCAGRGRTRRKRLRRSAIRWRRVRFGTMPGSTARSARSPPAWAAARALIAHAPWLRTARAGSARRRSPSASTPRLSRRAFRMRLRRRQPRRRQRLHRLDRGPALRRRPRIGRSAS